MSLNKNRSFAHSFPLNRETLLGAEHGPLAGAGHAAPLRVALVFPNTYAVGMSSLGYQIVYQVLHDLPGVRPERFFLDTLDEGSIETGAPLRDFDLAAFSAAFELDGVNVLDILERGGLPLRSADRGERDPVVLLGGVLASLNPLPLYPFIDCFAQGDAEAILPAFMQRLMETKNNSLSRNETLEALSEMPGISLGARTPSSAILIPHSAFRIPHSSAILTPHAEFADMGLIDLARGCRNHCTFCWVGQHSPPYRVTPADQVLAAAAALAPYTDRIGLVAAAVGAHPEIDAICTGLMARGMKISFSSLRVEEVTETMLRALAAGGQRGATIAPEAGSPRVRRLLGKHLGDAQIFDVIEQIFGLGLESLKMYFMIGVPTETDEEALEIAGFVERVREVMLRWARPRGRIGTLGVNLGIYVPKPGLPLGRLEPAPFETVKARLRKTARRLERIPNVALAAASPDEARAQAILSLGGIETADYLLLAHRQRMNWRSTNRDWLKTRTDTDSHGPARTNTDRHV